MKEGLAALLELNTFLDYLGAGSQCIFNPFLARGLEIYTGTIYEIFLSDQSIKSSIGSGGRYDNAIGVLLGTNAPFPTVGISFGLDVIYTAMMASKKERTAKSNVDYDIIPLNTQKEALLLATTLSNQGYKVEFELSNKKSERHWIRQTKKKYLT
ncbi:ATP phosphoribosyltransferase regulatory subunit [Alteribacter lacisalsi]|uniref:ATP phosphoribosyltransferase regulatory subunit n=1 Tax=Alteribacter lacisalsi TaxID=2045244 RepID=UPI00228703F1|nr:ATP phosphoribosyltransferase regulatory subunit [Alteribacter lacisalsi]